MVGKRDPRRIAALRARIAAIERATAGGATGPVAASPVAASPVAGADHAAGEGADFPGALAPGALHEVVGPGVAAFASAAGFVLGLVRARGAGLARRAAPVLWCLRGESWREAGVPYGPGLAAFDLDPARLVIARARRDADVLWAMEEGLRTPGLAAVIGEVGALDFRASRRLQLAAAARGGTAVVLRRDEAQPASAALTRWRVAPAPGAGIGGDGRLARWRAERTRCRGGRPGEWLVEWDDETGGFAVASTLRDGARAAERQGASA
jgi:protein ImuA